MINIRIFLPFLLFFSIHAEIYPKDIECFGVIGDSISAGFSMNSGSISKDFFEYRNQVFSIGRKENYRTLPNIFHQFNPNLNLSKSCASNYETIVSFNHNYNIDCNVAISGALSNHVIFMWEELYFQWLKYNCSNKWKVLTIMIGANDICAYCINGYNETISNYIMNIKQLIDNIYDDSQKIFINFISLFDVGVVLDWQNPKCDIVHILINECTCILGKKKSAKC